MPALSLNLRLPSTTNNFGKQCVPAAAAKEDIFVSFVVGEFYKLKFNKSISVAFVEKINRCSNGCL